MFGSGIGLDELSRRLGVAPDELVSATVEAVEDAVVICDTNARIFTWDDSASRLFGRDAASAMGRRSCRSLRTMRETRSERSS